MFSDASSLHAAPPAGVCSALPKTMLSKLAGRVGKLQNKALFPTVIALASLTCGNLAKASTVKATITGTLSGGTDGTGVFGFAPGTDLTGMSFTLEFTFDDTKGKQYSYPTETLIESTPSSNPGTATLTIGTGSFTFGVLAPNGPFQSEAARYGPGEYGELYFSAGDGSYGAGSGIQVQIYPSNPAVITDVDWESPFSDASLVNSPGEFEITEGAFDKEANGYLIASSVTVTGPGGVCGESLIQSDQLRDEGPPRSDRELENDGASCGLAITSPSVNEEFPLKESNSTATGSIPFSASGVAGQSISWTVTLSYTTSGGRGPFAGETKQFSTQPDTKRDQQYIAMGGKSDATARQDNTKDERAFFITGVEIANDAITERLINLYTNNGASNPPTPRLMTGLASKESSYRQFSTRPLYGTSAIWPLESFDGGSHIGLMMMPVNMQTAWSWLDNTQAAVKLFGQKLDLARTRMNQILKSHTGLPSLTDFQLENMALVLYGPFASSGLDKQYYAPACSSGHVDGAICKLGKWSWVTNTAGNEGGVAYADKVRSLIR